MLWRRSTMQRHGVMYNLQPMLMLWCLSADLKRRDAKRAGHVIAALPFWKRMRLTLGRDVPHARVLSYLRCIVLDESPRASISQPVAPSASPSGPPDGMVVDGTEHERRRRAGMVNAVLAAANARRVDVPLNDAGVSRTLAESREPLHAFHMDSTWVQRYERVPSAVFRKIGISQPKPPRRL